MKLDNHNAIYLTAALIALIGIFHLFVPRAEYKQWRDDANMFIHHARNISEGVPYAELNFIPNPHLNISPSTFPLVFPLILTPVYRTVGINRTAMKAVVALFFIASLAIFASAFWGALSPTALAMLIVSVGLSPFLWFYTEMIVSDIPFLFFAFLSLLVMERAGYEQAFKRRVLLAVATGLTVYLAYGSRSAGVVLLPVVFVLDYLRNGRPTLQSGVSAAVFLTFAVIQSGLTRSVSGYSSIFTFDARSIPLAFYLTAEYIRKFSYLWENGYIRAVAGVASVLFFLFAASGYVKRIKARPSAFEIFIPLYMALIAVYSAITPTGSNPRYLIPLVPLYFFYAFYGIEHSGLLRKKAACGKILAAAGVIVVASYAGAYSRMDIGAVKPVEEEKETVELFEYIRDNTPRDSVLITRTPRSFSLYTSRKTAFYHTPGDDAELWGFFKSIGATHLVVNRHYDSKYIEDFVERNRGRLRPEFSNADFEVFSLREQVPEHAPKKRQARAF